MEDRPAEAAEIPVKEPLDISSGGTIRVNSLNVIFFVGKAVCVIKKLDGVKMFLNEQKLIYIMI